MKEMPVYVPKNTSNESNVKQETVEYIQKQNLKIKQIVILNYIDSKIKIKLLDLDKDKILDQQIINIDPILNLNVNKINFFNKPVHNVRRHTLLTLLKPESDLYNFFIDREEDGCVALKKDDTWGFLFYYEKNNKFTFRFEPVHNTYNGTRLKETDKGYRDFVYILRSEALPKAYKIGRTDNPDKRLAQWRTANPREINRLVVLPDGRNEKVLLAKFDYCRIPGKTEWFEMDNELTKFIEEQKSHRRCIIDKYKKYLKEI